MATYTVTRTTIIDALPGYVRPRIADLREWVHWSPWEDLDENLTRTYTGAESGVGQRYTWKGNKKAGEGSMEVVEADTQRVRIAVNFLKPFKSSSMSVFTLRPEGARTHVHWTMEGQQNALMGLVGHLYPMDRMMGRDLEKGLARLKAAVEADKLA
ncbi:SRPBCC family protein [Mariniluteicoccus endophyticus]